MKLPSFPKTYNTYFVASIATIGGMLFGFDISSMSAIIPTDQYINYYNNPAGTLQGGISAALAGGSIVGCLVAGPLSDRLGRRDSSMVAAWFWMVGTAIQVGNQGYASLIVGRVVNGICVGITSSQVPVWLAEIAKKERRGTIIVIQQLAIEWGILIMYFIGYGCSFIAGEWSFRTAWALQWVPCVGLICGLPFLPRSPRWLATKDRLEEAIDVLSKIQAHGDRTDPLVIAEWEDITATIAAERSGGKGFSLFYKNGLWKRTLTGFSAQAWQQLAGANVMTYYITYVFEMAGLTGNINLVSSGVNDAVFVICTIIVFPLADKFGRRPMLVCGAIGMGICHFVIGGCLGSYGIAVPGGVDGNANVTIKVDGAASRVVIAFSYLMMVVYGLTLAPMCWVYAAEIWSNETRAKGMAWSALGNWIFNFALGFFIPPAFRNIKWKTYITFGVLCMGAATHFYFGFPETCGKTLEEIEFLFGKDAPPPWKTYRGGSRLDQHVQEVKEDVEKGVHRASITQVEAVV
ncbi:MAG: hypothetical protein M1834_002023 [Cirrosporium novae-zelandiae]|nr:MAG: hypothetical protein M1834_002023 [Cirrosporium novae-zelandiae]